VIPLKPEVHSQLWLSQLPAVRKRDTVPSQFIESCQLFVSFIYLKFDKPIHN